MIQQYQFNKEDQSWYIDLPEWTGSKDDLEMVLGADTLLNTILDKTRNDAFADDSVQITFSDTEHLKHRLTKMYDDYEFGGAWYWCEEFEHKLWLCEVTRFVFGIMPDIIYYQY